jgi:Dual-action HEIGH metallo-peptidase
MKLQKLTLVAIMFSVLGLGACQQEEENVVKKEDISQETLDKIHQMGFGTTDVKKLAEGYLVEGDIVLTEEQLNDRHDAKLLRIGQTEQYRTTNLVSGLPRTIKVSVSSSLSSAYVAALDEALSRYNAQSLRIKFSRVSSGANIALTKAPSGAAYLATAGFPANGNPYNSIKVNADYLGNNPPKSYLATIIAHELGHCIGFRHTDYMDRAYSCGGTPTNEGASNVGAIHIPGTATAADPGSWMLACIGSGQNRPFNNNDRTALNYLY